MKSFKDYFVNEDKTYTIVYDTNPTGAFKNTITVSKKEFTKIKNAYDANKAQKSGFNKFIIDGNNIELGYNFTIEFIDINGGKTLWKVLKITF